MGVQARANVNGAITTPRVSCRFLAWYSLLFNTSIPLTGGVSFLFVCQCCIFTHGVLGRDLREKKGKRRRFDVDTKDENGVKSASRDL